MEKQEPAYTNPDSIIDYCEEALREMGCKLPDPETTDPADEDMWAKPDPAPDGDNEAASEEMRLRAIRQYWLCRRYDIAREMLPIATCSPDGFNGPESAAALAVAYADALIKLLRKEDDE